MLSQRRKAPVYVQGESKSRNESTIGSMSRPAQCATPQNNEEAEDLPINSESVRPSRSNRNKNILVLLLSITLVTGVVIILVVSTHPHFQTKSETVSGQQSPQDATAMDSGSIPNAYQPFNRTIRVACAGDSLTLGEIGTTPGDNYPSQLQQLLGDAFETHNYGVNSVTAIRGLDKSYNKTQAYQDSISLDADIYLLMLGTNDAKFWAKRSQDFGTDMEWIIDQPTRRIVSASSPATRIILAIPPWVKGDYGGIKNDVLVNNIQPAIRQFAAAKKLQLVDMYAITLNQSDFYINDRLHLNAKGYQSLAQAWKNAIECNYDNVCDTGENCETCSQDCRLDCT